MKRTIKITAVTIIMAVILSAFTISVFAAENADDIKITIDGEYINFDAAPFIENDHTMVPFRTIFETFGFEVNYNEKTRIIYASMVTDKNSLQYYIYIDDKKIYCEGVEYNPDVLAEDKAVPGKMESQKIGSVSFYKDIDVTIISNRTFVPARVIAESLGCKVNWDNTSKTVLITSENAVITGDENYAGLPAKVTLDRSGITEAKSAKFRVYEDEVIRLVNEERVKNGLPVLAANGDLAKIARMKAEDMIDNGYFSHLSPTYGSPEDMLNQYAPKVLFSGECIAGGKTPDYVFTAWMDSPPHKNILLKESADCIGVGMATDGKICRWVLIVGNQK